MKKIALVLSALLGFSVSSAHSQTLDGLTTGIDGFSNLVAPAIPSATNIGLNWSDAWVGDLLGIPPHFGIGVTAGAISLPIDGFKQVTGALGIPLPAGLDSVPGFGIPLPAYTVEARVGGFILPFDVGLKFGTLPGKLDSGNVAIDYNVIGADIRYALLQDGLILPGISIGAGITSLKGGVGYGFGNITLGNVDDGSGPGNLDLVNPKIGFKFETLAYDFKAQISKSLLIITPYAGAGMTIADTKVGTGLYSDGLTYKLAPVDAAKAAQLANAYGIPFTTTGFEKINNKLVTVFRLYGGTSINLAILKLDIQALYNFGDLANLKSGSLGLTLGARVQL